MTATATKWRDRQRAERRTGRIHGHPGKSHIVTDRDGERLLAEIPPDTRDLTGRICGDPLPGRSALAQRQAKQQWWGR